MRKTLNTMRDLKPDVAYGKLSKVPWYIIHSGWRAKLWWDMWGVAILIFTVIIVPMRLAFDKEEHCPDPFWWIEAVVDVCFVLDLIFTFFTGVYVESDGEMVLSTNLKTIAYQYVWSWFAVDFISAAPIDLVFSIAVNGCDGDIPAANATNGQRRGGGGASTIGNTARLVRILRLIKLLKILRVLKLQNRMAELGDRVPMLNSPILKIFPTLFGSIYFAHCLACGFFAVGAVTFYGFAPSDLLQRQQTWIGRLGLDVPVCLDGYSQGVAWQDECTTDAIEWHQLGPAYVAALYWVFTTITTVGYGDITSETTGERIYAIFAMIVGTGLFGYILSTMTTLLSDSIRGNVQMQAKLNQLQQFMDNRALPYELKLRIRRHFRYCWSRALTIEQSEAEILKQLSTPLRKETLHHMYRSLVSSNPLFSLVDDPAYRDVMLRAVRPMLIAPEEVLMTQATLGEEAFLLAHGQLEIRYNPSMSAPGRKHATQSTPTPARHAARRGSLAGFDVDDDEEDDDLDVAFAAPTSHTQEEMPVSGEVIGEVRGGQMDSFVGEVALFEETGSKRHLRSATVIAKSHCELYAVSAHVFGEICKKYPQARRVMLTLARQRVERTDSLRKEYLRKTQGWRVALDVMRLAAPSTSSSIGQASASADAGIALTDLSVSAPSPSAAPARAPSPSAAPASAP